VIRRLLAAAAVVVAACGLTLGAAAAASAAPEIPPAPTIEHPVVDTTGTLSHADIAKIDAAAASGHAKTGQQTAVLLTKTTGGDLEGYSIAVARAWGVGDADSDNGVLILVSLDEHKLRIEVGRGLEGDIPDAVANRIISDDMVPRLRSGDVGGAILAGVQKVQVGVGTTPPAAHDEGPAFDALWPILIPGLVVAAVMGLLFLIGGLVLGRARRKAAAEAAEARHAAENTARWQMAKLNATGAVRRPSERLGNALGAAAATVATSAAVSAAASAVDAARERARRRREEEESERSRSSSGYGSGSSYGSDSWGGGSSSFDSGSSFGGGGFDGGGASGSW
jgi:uncharacterized protein